MLFSRRLMGLMRDAPGPAALTVLAALTASGASIVQWFLTATVIRRVFTGDLASLLGLLVATAGAVIVRSGLFWWRDLAAANTAASIKLRLRDELSDHLEHLGPGYTTVHETGAIQATMADGVEQLDAYVGYYLPHAIVAVLTPALLVGALAWIDPWVGLITGVCVVLVVVARPLWRSLLGSRASRHWAAYSRFAARIHDSLQGMTTLKLLGASERHGEALARDVGHLYRATVRNLMAGMGVYILTSLVMGLGTALATAVGALRFASGHISLFSLLLVLFLSAECFRPLQELQNYWHEGFGGLASANGIFAMRDATPPVTEEEGAVTTPHGGTTSLPVQFDAVTFTYPTSTSPAVEDVTLSIEPGQTLAVVGRSGSGKSTLVALLLRFFDPERGRVLVGGTDLKELTLAQARSQVAVVSQDSYLFHGTIAQNLRLAQPEATDEEIESAAKVAGIHDTIVSWPDGYSTLVGERGATVSGGERQRIAIARALLCQAPVLVLDEATASVDGQAEAALQTAVAELTRDRTTLVIAHRLSTVASADKVAVLDRGRLVEYGSPTQLSMAKGPWSRLVAAQVTAQSGGDSLPIAEVSNR